MNKLKSLFSKDQLATLSEIGITITEEHDYSDDELIGIHDRITDYYMDHGFDRDGEPLPLAYRCESLIDLFYDKLGI